MVSKETFKNGLLSYLDSEIIPHLPTVGKWGIGAFIVLASSKYDQLIDGLQQNAVCKALGLISDEGLIDEEALMNALTSSADKYGNMTVAIPVIGTLTFSKEDVLKLNSYIHNGGSNGRFTY